MGSEAVNRKRRSAPQGSAGNLDVKKPEEVYQVLEESPMESCEAEDGECERQLVLQEDEDPEKVTMQERAMSAGMEASIQEIRQKVDQFTQQVSGLLEAVKNFFAETSNAFEERIVLLHQAQIDKWEEEIKLLGMIDAENEEIDCRLSNAQVLLSNM